MYSDYVLLALFLLVGGSFGLSLSAFLKSRRRFMSHAITKKLRDLDVEIANHGDLLDRHAAILKKLTNRKAVQEHRERKRQEAEARPQIATNETPEEFKRRMRLELAQGRLRP